ncbi:discoidin domain-containing protein [Acetobacter indonesiensis]
MIDLALGKPATQSSKHPDILLPLAVDAANANRPDSPDAHFQTAAEWFPWWQVDLEELCIISEVVLYNTSFWPGRARRFSILVSQDTQTWEDVFSKTDHSVFGDNDETAYKVVFPESVIGRFVRVRLDNWDHLHLKSVRVYGEPCRATLPINTPEMLLSSPEGIIVFATNYNEEDRFLPVYIDNFLNFTSENCHIFINFPKSRQIPTDLLTQNPRVHIFNGAIERKKWGGTLLLGHMESYGEALRTLGKIDYFCTCASNGLFIRPFDFAAAVRRLELKDEAPVGMTRPYLIDADLKTLPREGADMWVWNNLRNAHGLVEYIEKKLGITKFSLNQIEGLFAESYEWNKLYLRINELTKCNEYFGIPVFETPALEEFIPVTFFRHFGNGRFANICYMLWDPIREIIFPDLLQCVQKLPAHMCQIKWFNRDPDSAPTAALSHAWSRALLETLSNEETSEAYHDRFLNRVLTQSFSDAFKKNEVYTPLTRLWRSDARWGRVQWIYSSLLPQGGKIKVSPAFPGTPTQEDGISSAWVLSTDPIHDSLQYEAVVAEEHSATTLHLQVNREGEAFGRHEWGDTRAILFLSPLAEEKAQVFRLSLHRPFEYTHEQLMHNIRRSDGQSNFAWPLIMQEDEGDMRHFYFLRPQTHKGEIWIGIPAFLRTSIVMELAFGISAV